MATLFAAGTATASLLTALGSFAALRGFAEPGGLAALRSAAGLLAAAMAAARQQAFNSAIRQRWQHFDSQPQAGSQHLGAAQQAGAQAAGAQGAGAAQAGAQALGASQQAGAQQLFSQQRWQRAAQPLARGWDGSSSARSRKPSHSTWGLRSTSGLRKPWGLRSTPGRSSSSRSSDGSRPTGSSAARRGWDGTLRLAAASLLTALRGFARRGARRRSRTALRCFTTARSAKTGPSNAGGGHDAQSEEGHRRQQKTTLHGSYSL